MDLTIAAAVIVSVPTAAWLVVQLKKLSLESRPTNEDIAMVGLKADAAAARLERFEKDVRTEFEAVEQRFGSIEKFEKDTKTKLSLLRPETQRGGSPWKK